MVHCGTVVARQSWLARVSEMLSRVKGDDYEGEGICLLGSSRCGVASPSSGDHNCGVQQAFSSFFRKPSLYSVMPSLRWRYAPFIHMSQPQEQAREKRHPESNEVPGKPGPSYLFPIACIAYSR